MASEHDTFGIEDLSERLSRRRLLELGMAAGALAVVPALRPSSAFAGDTDLARALASGSDTLKWALAGSTKSLDVANGLDNVSGTLVMALIFDSLVTYGNDLKVKPLLAQSWSARNPRSYVYKLRRGVTFSDGSPLTAEDVAFSIQRHIDPKVGSQANYFFLSVKSVKVTAPGEVTLNLNNPDATFKFSPVVSYILQKKFVLAMGDRFGAPGTPISVLGTGPYEVTSYRAGQGITLKRNPRYWGKRPPFEKIEFTFISDPVTRQLAMRSGDIDGSFDVAPDQADQWARVGDTRVITAPGMKVEYMSFDMSRSPWDDIHVRKTFAHALDRRGIVKSLLHGQGLPANSLIPPPMWAGLLPPARIKSLYASLPNYAFDMKKAAAELAQSSAADGFDASITYPSQNVTLGKALLSLASNLKKLNINLSVKQVPEDQWIDTIYAHKNLGLQSINFVPDYPDAVNYMLVVLPSSQAVKNGFNVANYKNKSVDNLLVKQASAQSVARARELATVMRIIANDLPYLPMYWTGSAMAINKRNSFRGFNALYYYQQWIFNVAPK